MIFGFVQGNAFADIATRQKGTTVAHGKTSDRILAHGFLRVRGHTFVRIVDAVLSKKNESPLGTGMMQGSAVRVNKNISKYSLYLNPFCQALEVIND